MLKAIVAFLVLTAVLFFSIEKIRDMTYRERWSVTKTAVYAMILSLVSVSLLVGFVILF